MTLMAILLMNILVELMQQMLQVLIEKILALVVMENFVELKDTIGNFLMTILLSQYTIIEVYFS
jgi:hypothetical protein